MNILCSNPLAQFKSKQKIIENTVKKVFEAQLIF